MRSARRGGPHAMIAWACLAWGVGCHEEEAPTPPPFWVDLGPIPLEPLRLLATEPLPNQRAQALLPLPETGQWMIQMQEIAVVLDERFHHDGARCIDGSDWSAEIGDRQGGCADGEVLLSRGRLEAGARLAGIAASAEEVWLLKEDGGLARAPLDPFTENPYDYLRLTAQGSAPGAEAIGASPWGPAVAAGGEIRGVADGALFGQYDGRITAMAASGTRLWLLRSSGVGYLDQGGTAAWIEGEGWGGIGGIAGIGAAGQVDGETGAILAAPGGIWRLSEAGAERLAGPEELAAAGVGALNGAVAVDRGGAIPGGWRLWAAATGGLASWAPGEGLRWWPLGGSEGQEIEAVGAWAHQIVTVAGGVASLYGDETALVANPPLQVGIMTFIERPRKEGDDVSCRGDESVTAFVERAAAQAAWLDTMPLPILLGLTPFAAERIEQCGVARRGEGIWENFWDPATNTTEPGQRTIGVLYHEPVDACDRGCYADRMAERAEQLCDLGLWPSWFGGIAPHEDLGIDWVGGLVEAHERGDPVPLRLLFPNVAYLPEIDFMDDPRAKDPWPRDPSVSADARRFGSAGIEVEGGPMLMVPGYTLSMFSLEGCANLSALECFEGGSRSTNTISAGDTTAAQVLLFRALAARAEGRPGAFTLHLPDIGQFDYTVGCDSVTGDAPLSGCSAANLQAWALDVRRRYQLNGLIAPINLEEIESQVDALP